MKTAIIAFVVLAVIFLLLIMPCCKASGDYNRIMEKEDPCDNCLRWEECNGVDKDCPWRDEDGK